MIYGDLVDEFYLGDTALAEEDIGALSEAGITCTESDTLNTGELEYKIISIVPSVRKDIKIPFYMNNKLGKFLYEMSGGQLRLMLTEELKLSIESNNKNYLVSLARRELFKSDEGVERYLAVLSDRAQDIFRFVLNAGCKVSIKDISKEFNEDSQLVTKMLHKTPILFLEEKRDSGQKRWVVIPDEIFRGKSWGWFTCKHDIYDIIGGAPATGTASKRYNALLADIASIISFFNSTDVRVLKGGKVNKRIYENLKELVSHSDDEYIDFLVQFCVTKIVRVNESLIQVDIPQTIKWLKSATTDDFMLFWRERNPLSGYFVEIASHIPKNYSFCADKIVDFLHVCQIEASRNDFQVMLKELVWTGLMNEEEGDGNRFSFESPPENLLDSDNKSIIFQEQDCENAKFVLQPNGEIILPLQSNFDNALFLSCFAKRVPCHMVVKFVITKDSVLRGLERELDAKKALDFLRDNCFKEIPQNIYHLIETCSKKFGEIEIISGNNILKASEAIILQELKLKKESSGFLGKDVDDTVVMLSEEVDIKKFMSILKEEGYFPKVEKDVVTKINSKKIFRDDLEKICQIVNAHIDCFKSDMSHGEAGALDTILKKYL